MTGLVVKGPREPGGQRIDHVCCLDDGPGVMTVAFWLPEFMAVSAWIEHAPFAFWLVDAMKPGAFVALGTFRGYSYLAVCQAIQWV